MRRACCLQWLTTSALALGFVLAPAIAEAHAAFVSSTPNPGAKLASAPGVVVIRFSEPLVKGLSQVVVADPTGATSEGQASGERNLVGRISTNVPGVYQVRWTEPPPVPSACFESWSRPW